MAGLTFKEDCPDIRNSKVFDLIDELVSFGCDVDCYDPIVNSTDLLSDLKLKSCVGEERYDAVVFAVRHSEIISEAENILSNNLLPKNVVQDLKGILPINSSDLRF